ncbi:MAG: FliA/WhiG family RNA polymerase sigma factor [Acidobacteriaceae bacterium]|nr:FliA/WhiG family RNA polymerase sigma factor [Acidobacteriaceae bacterium]
MYAYASLERSVEERDELVLEHLPQVNWIASRIHEKLPPNVELDDLISAGVVGLLAAVDNFDPTRNTTLRTYAEYKIRGAILDSIRGLDGIPIHKRKRLKQVQQAIAAAERRIRGTPGEEEIAAELNIPLSEYQQWMVELRAVSLGSLQMVDGEERDILQFLSDDEDCTPARLLERAELQRVITEGMRKMPENERTVLSLYYKEELNLREIGTVMNLHTTRISQLRAQAILRLRALMEYKWPTERGLY